MPETRERDPYHNFIDFVDMFFVPFWEQRYEPSSEGMITIIGTSTQKFTREERQMLNHIKQIAQDVEFEEIQG